MVHKKMVHFDVEVRCFVEDDCVLNLFDRKSYSTIILKLLFKKKLKKKNYKLYNMNFSFARMRSIVLLTFILYLLSTR